MPVDQDIASDGPMDSDSPDEGGDTRGRQRLRPWLEAQINSQKYPGLHWIDQKKGIFYMKWKHSGRTDWCPEDGLVFKAWAIHTGRYKEGEDNIEFPTWKTRLRCALNKQPNIRELKHLSCNDEPNPYRVFQFIDKRGDGPPSPSELYSPQPVSEVDTLSVSGSPGSQALSPATQMNIPTVVKPLDSEIGADQTEDYFNYQVESLGSDLRDISFQDLVKPENSLPADLSVGNSLPETMDTDSLKGIGNQSVSQQTLRQNLAEKDPMYYQTSVGDHEMTVELRYRTEIIKHVTVRNPSGCRVFFGDLPYREIWNEEVFGDIKAEQIVVPYEPGRMKTKQDELTKSLLSGLELGISIFLDKRSIYIHRRCKTRLMIAAANRGETMKVNRHEMLEIFNFSESFLPAFMQYQQGEGPRPSPKVIIAVGQDFHPEVEPYSDLLLSVTVCHGQASHLLAQNVPDPASVETSLSNECDQYMEQMKACNATVPISKVEPPSKGNFGIV